MGNSARKMARRRAKQLSSSVHGRSADATRLPFGPCFMSEEWREDDGQPGLVTVMVTRALPGRQFLGGMALVDRTCLGVKNGHKTKPLSKGGLNEYVERLSEFSRVEEVAPLEALSVVYHALDYAAKLGFNHHPDFPVQIFGPRPASLLDTPHADDPKPLYVSRPDDDADWVIQRLNDAVGNGNYDFFIGADFTDLDF